MISARHAQQSAGGLGVLGTWADTTMRRPASPVAHALLTGIEGVSIALASFYEGKGADAHRSTYMGMAKQERPPYPA